MKCLCRSCGYTWIDFVQYCGQCIWCHSKDVVPVEDES